MAFKVLCIAQYAFQSLFAGYCLKDLSALQNHYRVFQEAYYILVVSASVLWVNPRLVPWFALNAVLFIAKADSSW